MAWNAAWRDALMPELAASEWDLIVVGGGITGAGILREAARRGWRCLLLEQRDFAWGTSSRSSKMVHGGLRYLAKGRLGLTRDAVRALKAAYRCEGVNVGTNLGRAAGAGVPTHLHTHVLPRWEGDSNFMTSVALTRVLPEPLDVTWRKLRDAWPT